VEDDTLPNRGGENVNDEEEEEEEEERSALEEMEDDEGVLPGEESAAAEPRSATTAALDTFMVVEGLFIVSFFVSFFCLSLFLGTAVKARISLALALSVRYEEKIWNISSEICSESHSCMGYCWSEESR